MNSYKPYNGRVPACGVFCGGCPVYIRNKKACTGAEQNISKCEGCKTFHLCCKSRGINHCFECKTFPCYKFKTFAKRWLKYGQNMIINQNLMKEIGNANFLEYMNKGKWDIDI